MLKPYSGMVTLLVLFALVSNGINLFIPLIISRAIDDLGSGTLVLTRVIINFAIASTLILVFSYLQGMVQTYTSEKAAKDLRVRLSERISGQTFSWVMHTNPAKLLTNLTSDVDAVKMFISQAVISIISSVFILTGACIMLLSINWKLAAAVLVIVPIISTLFFIMFRKVRVLFKRGREVIDWLNRIIDESILGSTLIRVLNSQQQEYRKFMKANTESRDIGLAILSLFAALVPLITFLSNLALLTVLALGGHFVIQGNMTLGDFAAFNSYISILIFPILIIGFMSNAIAFATAAHKRIQVVLDAPDIKEDGSVKATLTGSVSLSGVNVYYGDKPALKDIAFDIPRGSRTAIIGPTAAGKTQLLYLLTGLIKPDKGQVLFDGRDISVYDKESFYRQIGFVFQDSVIFNMSLHENIAFSEHISDEMLEKAINTAELKGFVDSLPLKLNTIVSERGASLSGGQRQRIMLARALALNPRILLLDDFTARVDRRTERKILENIRVNYPDLTVIAVTQKISTVEHFEHIILLMESEVIAAGTHDELMQSCPEYVQIYNSQRSTSHYDLQS